MLFPRFTASRNGFSILELTLALAFLLLFSVGVMEIFYRTVHGSYQVSFLDENRRAFETIRGEIETNCHQASDLSWDQNSATLTVTQPSGTILYQVQNHQLMKNKGNGWYLVPEAEHVETFAPDIISNPNGKLLVLVMDFKASEETLHTRCAFAVKNQTSF